MNRAKIPSGSVVNLSEFTEKLFNFIEENLHNRFDNIFKHFGKIYGFNLSFSNTIDPIREVIISPGKGFTQNGEYIELKNSLTINVFNYIGETVEPNTIYYIKLKYKHLTLDPVNVMYSFYYGGEYIQYTSYKDSFDIVINSNPVKSNDEILIGSVKTNNTGSSLISNYLVSENSIIKINELYYDNSIVFLKNENNVVSTNTTFNNVTVSGALILNNPVNFISTSSSQINSNVPLKINVASQNILETNSSNVKINGDLILTGNLVLTSQSIAPNIVNFNINVEPIGSEPYQSPDNSTNMKPLISNIIRQTSNKLKVTLSWGYNGIYGSNTELNKSAFIVGNSNISLTGLNGHFIYFPHISKNYRISSVSGNTLYLENCNEVIQVNPDSNLKAIIHPNCDEYIINYGVGDSIEEQIILKSSLSKLIRTTVLYLTPGLLYNFSIYGKNLYNSTSTAYLQKVIKLDLVNLTGTVNVNAYEMGFSVEILGWEGAEQFEIIYDEAESTVFDNSNVYRLITSSRKVDISVSKGGRYIVKVRPLISGQQVGNEIVKYVTVRSVIQQNEILLFNIPVDLHVITGNYILPSPSEAISSSNFIEFIVSSSSKGEFLSSNNITVFPNLEGKLLTITNNNTEYNLPISSIYYGTNDIRIICAKTDQNISIPSSGSFTIGIGKRSRRIIKITELPYDTVLTRILINVNVIRRSNPSYSVMLRVYQEYNENNYDSIILSQDNTTYTLYSDLEIYSINGTRSLILDLYNPTNPNSSSNSVGFNGFISVFGKPLVNIRQTVNE